MISIVKGSARVERKSSSAPAPTKIMCFAAIIAGLGADDPASIARYHSKHEVESVKEKEKQDEIQNRSDGVWRND
jgi:hypothetical protein